MEASEQPPPQPPPNVRVGRSADGTYTYVVNQSPDTLPAVRGRDLEAAWDAARQAALADNWGAPRAFRFRRDDGTVTDLALADPDARCWANAVDRMAGMSTSYGLSIFLRLLALVDLLAQAAWAMRMVHLARDGADLHPLLLRAAATVQLTVDARFDVEAFRARLGPLATDFALNPPASAAQLAGTAP
jgi:hypothetical protein